MSERPETGEPYTGSYRDPAALAFSGADGYQDLLAPPAPAVSAAGAGERVVAEEIRGRVAAALAERARQREDTGLPPLSPNQRRQEAGELLGAELERNATAALRSGRAALDADAETRVSRAVLDGLLGLGPLQELLEDPLVENIFVNGCDRVFVQLSDGTIRRAASVAGSDGELVELVRTVAARSGVEERRFDRGVPRLSVQLPDGSRLFAVMAVTARPSLTIRRHRHRRVRLQQLLDLGTVDYPMAEFLAAAVRSRRNILITGGPSVGKTTLLRALAAEIPPYERLVVIEDTTELDLDADTAAHPTSLAMQGREANIEGAGAVDLAELVRWSLRMSPDRVIVGEVRGPELVPMLNVMSQGTDGSMATLHSSTSRGVFTKLAAYAAQSAERLDVEATNLLIAAAVHLIVHLGYTRDRVRAVASVREVIDADGPQIISNEVFRPDHSGRATPAAPLREETLDALAAAGFDPALARATSGW